MDRIRAAAATVAIVSTNNSFAEQIVAMVADDATTVVIHTLIAALLTALSTSAPDIVVVDDEEARDPADDIRQIRRRLPAVQVAYVNVANERRVIDLLHWGADDAIEKDGAVLTARLQSAARRARTLNAQNRIAVGDVIFDRESRRVWCAGKEVELTPHEFSVVDCLFWNTPKPVDFESLAAFVWGETPGRMDRKSLVQVYVSYVRRKLGASKSVTIQHSKGLGYLFVPKTAAVSDSTE